MKFTNLSQEEMDYLRNDPKVPNNDSITDEESWYNNAKINSANAISRADAAVGALLEGYRKKAR